MKRRPRIIATVADRAGPSAGRGARGHFAPGNTLARGRRSPNDELRAAVRRACTPKQLGAVVAMLVRRARRGDVHAASLLLNRTLGRAREERADVGRGLELGDLGTVHDVRRAAALVAASAARGDVDVEVAREVGAQLRTVGELLVSSKLAEEVEDLKRRFAAANLEHRC